MKEQTQKIKKLKLADYELKQVVGTGSFGRVKLIRRKADGKHFALKILNKQDIIKLKQVDHIYSEVTILDRIDFPFLIRMEGITQDERYVYIVLEYIPGGELFTYIRTVQNLKEEDARVYSAQVTLMFEYLHGLEIVYRDLKPENLLIDGKGFLKLTDFGFAKKIDGRTYTLCGTPEYLAPEILLQKGHGKSVDWWCLGILTYEMIVGIDPFSDDDPMTVYQNILRGKVKFPSSFPKNAKSLVKHLLVADLGKRYGNLKGGAGDIKNHRWFKKFNWDKLLAKKTGVPFVPKVNGEGDTSNYSNYPDDAELPKKLAASEDPFLQW